MIVGSKPEALRTEYAEEGNYDGAYHGDIVFYIQRAGDGGGDSFNDDGSLNKQALDDPYFNQGPEPIYDGPFGLGAGVGAQTLWNQVYFGSGYYSDNNYYDRYDYDYKDYDYKDYDYDYDGGPAGNISDEDDQFPGVWTEAAARLNELREAISNAFPNLESFDGTEILRSSSASEYFFNNALGRRFTPDASDDILETLERGSKADLAADLAKASGNVMNSADLIAGINSGSIGYVTESTKAANILTGRNTGRTYRSMR